MFTGIIEGLGRVISILPEKEGKNLQLALPYPKSELALGQSIAVNGACLTISKIGTGDCTFFLSDTTINTTNLGSMLPGEEVNLERPLRIDQGLGGHLVTGHVDTVSIMLEIDGQQVCFSLPEAIRPFVVEKGSVAIDGISLTIASLAEDSFRVAIIPHTWNNTTLRNRRPGDKVNVEGDLIARYVVRFLSIHQGYASGEKQALTLEHLERTGFLFEDE